MALVTCAGFPKALFGWLNNASDADKEAFVEGLNIALQHLQNCSGVLHPEGTHVPSCDEMNSAIASAVSTSKTIKAAVLDADFFLNITLVNDEIIKVDMNALRTKNKSMLVDDTHKLVLTDSNGDQVSADLSDYIANDIISVELVGKDALLFGWESGDTKQVSLADLQTGADVVAGEVTADKIVLTKRDGTTVDMSALALKDAILAAAPNTKVKSFLLTEGGYVITDTEGNEFSAGIPCCTDTILASVTIDDDNNLVIIDTAGNSFTAKIKDNFVSDMRLSGTTLILDRVYSASLSVDLSDTFLVAAKDKFLKTVAYDKDNQQMVFTVGSVAEGTTDTEIRVDVADFLPVVASDGLSGTGISTDPLKVKRSNIEGNIVTVTADGVYAPTPTVVTALPIGGNGSATTPVKLVLSTAAHNVLTVDTKGLYAADKSPAAVTVDGSKITITLADGTTVSGEVTGGKGVTGGKYENGNVILTLQDGTTVKFPLATATLSAVEYADDTGDITVTMTDKVSKSATLPRRGITSGELTGDTLTITRDDGTSVVVDGKFQSSLTADNFRYTTVALRAQGDETIPGLYVFGYGYGADFATAATADGATKSLTADMCGGSDTSVFAYIWPAANSAKRITMPITDCDGNVLGYGSDVQTWFRV